MNFLIVFGNLVSLQISCRSFGVISDPLLKDQQKETDHHGLEFDAVNSLSGNDMLCRLLCFWIKPVNLDVDKAKGLSENSPPEFCFIICLACFNHVTVPFSGFK